VAEDLQLALDLYPDGEVWIREPRHHGEQIHGGGLGCVAIAHKTAKGGWREHVYPVEAAIELLNHYRGREDVYLSTQRFSGRRRVAKLLSLSSLYADLDYYDMPKLAGLHPYMVLDLALERLEAHGVPPPTLGIASGRGLYLVWQHEHIRRSALPRWNACQRRLWEVLAPLGADAQAKDAARVLRVVGTRNGRSPVYALLPVGETFAFNDLADRVLPYTRAELRDLRIQKALRASRSPSERFVTPPEGYSAATLHEARLSDLQKLRELRFFDSQMTDYRHRWLFFSAVSMSWLASSPYAMRRELFELAREAGSWSEERTAGKLGSVVRRTYAAFAGEKVEWRGEEFDPRYRYTNQRIIEELEITSEEERRMRTLVSDEERRRRHREKERERKRESGEVEMSRTQYLTRAAKRRVEARRLNAQGLSVRQIAGRMGISKSQVQRALSSSDD
jgi:hypothetical protein